MDAWQGVKMMSMLRKERAQACGGGGSKADLSGDRRLALAASPEMSERIGEVLDASIGGALQELAVFRHFPLDLCSRRLRQVPVSGGVPTDGHQGVLRQAA